MAIESGMITADVIEITEFPDLAQRYRVTAVPKTIIADSLELLGAQSEARLLAEILAAATPPETTA
jgi:hypothetical protein